MFFSRDPGSPFKKDQVIIFRGLRVRIMEVNERGPTRMAFTFDRSLDDPGYVFYKLRQGKLQTLPPPALGQSLTL